MAFRIHFILLPLCVLISLPCYFTNEILQSKVKNLLMNPKKLISLYSEHVTHSSDELTQLFNEIHDDIFVSSSPPDASAPRHILTVLTDDQGWGDIGYNDPTFVTPTLDFFANRGIKFDNFYVHVRPLSPPPP